MIVYKEKEKMLLTPSKGALNVNYEANKKDLKVFNYPIVVFLCGLGVDSVASIVEYHEKFGVNYQYGFMIVNKTPLSHQKLEEYALLLTERIIEKFNTNLKLIITEPVKIKVEKPPACRWVWKQVPTQRFLKSLKHCLIITGQRATESILQSKLGEKGVLYGKPVFRPVYNKTKTYCFRKAVEIMPELDETWRKLYAETKHTSLDCIKCLRRSRK